MKLTSILVLILLASCGKTIETTIDNSTETTIEVTKDFPQFSTNNVQCEGYIYNTLHKLTTGRVNIDVNVDDTETEVYLARFSWSDHIKVTGDVLTAEFNGLSQSLVLDIPNYLNLELTVKTGVITLKTEGQELEFSGNINASGFHSCLDSKVYVNSFEVFDTLSE